ncbi:MAG: hypothetical protein AAF517_09390 [Planctomycetota bacterium]
MSLLNYLFDNDWFQRSDIEKLKNRNRGLESSVSRSRSRSKRTEDRVQELESQIGELALFNQTLLRMLIEKDVCTPSEFTNLFQMVDLEDGVADGRVTPERVPGQCSSCRRKMPKNKAKCMYCGWTAEAS